MWSFPGGYPDLSKAWLFWGPIYTPLRNTGSFTLPLEGPMILRVTHCFGKNKIWSCIMMMIIMWVSLFVLVTLYSCWSFSNMIFLHSLDIACFFQIPKRPIRTFLHRISVTKPQKRREKFPKRITKVRFHQRWAKLESENCPALVVHRIYFMAILNTLQQFLWWYNLDRPPSQWYWQMKVYRDPLLKM